MRFIYLLLLMPFLGLAQTNLVRWEGTTDLAPTIQNNLVSADNFSANGLNNLQASYDGIHASGWPIANNIDLNKYYQIVVKPVLNSQITLTNINFGYKGNSRNYEIRISKNSDFTNATTIHSNGNADYYNTDIPNANVSGLNIAITGGETLYIRFYAYNGHNGGGNWRIRNGINLQGIVTGQPTAMAGNYIIGSTPSADFPTITSAVAALNTVGVGAPVTFLLDNSYYGRSTNEIFPIILSPYTGNVNHTVTFKPNTAKNVTIESTNLGSVAVPAVFKLNGVDNVVFDGSNNGSNSRNLIIYNNNPIADAEKAVIWVASENPGNGANNNIVKNLTLKQVSPEGAVAAGVFSGSAGSATSIAVGTPAAASNTSNKVVNVLFEKVGQAVYVNGNATSPSAKWQITNNVIGSTVSNEKPFLGIYLNNAENYEIIGNSIVGVLKNTNSYEPKHSGVIITGNSQGIINGNTIRDVYNAVNWTPCAGILIESGNNIISNNMISNVRGINSDNGTSNIHTRGHGIYLKAGNSNKVFFNTVFMNAAGNSNFRSSALYLAAGTGHVIKNNIFYNSQAAGNQYGIYAEVLASAFTSDYNNFVPGAANQFAAFYNGNNMATVTAWKIATGKDLNSVQIVPVFVSQTDLHIDGNVQSNITAFDAKGTPVQDMALDIDGQVRHNIVPDMGADEFGPKCIGGTTTWNGTTWSNGLPNENKAAVFLANYTSSSDLTACTVSVINNAVINVPSGFNLTVQDEIVVSEGANLIVQNNANLVQVNKVDNIGKITVKRNASIRRLDYVYWSSPVKDQNLKAFSPQTVSPPVGSSRFYTLDEQTNSFVTVDPLITEFVPASGYMIRAPNNFSNNITTFTGSFTGVANNGDISVSVTNTGGGYNLIGNPYPSTIDADRLLATTPGTLHFWTHIDQTSGNGVNYATYNLSGGIASRLGGVKPTSAIQVGQGFVMKVENAATVTFNNDMRISQNNATFFRSDNTFERHRMWLNMAGPDGPLAQIMIAYITGATLGEDISFDGRHISGTPFLASNIGGDKYAIQARPLPFDHTDLVGLTYTALVAGSYTISIDDVDGMFAEGQQIFIKDIATGITHDLTAAPYTFDSTVGTFSDRLAIVYQNATLSVEAPVLDSSNLIVYKKDGSLHISTGLKDMNTVRIFDIRGRMLYENTALTTNTTSVQMSGTASQILIVQVTSSDKSIATKKVVY